MHSCMLIHLCGREDRVLGVQTGAAGERRVDVGSLHDSDNIRTLPSQPIGTESMLHSPTMCHSMHAVTPLPQVNHILKGKHPHISLAGMPCALVPRYQDYQASDIPVVEDSSSGSRVRVMAGQHAGTTGPISMVNPGMLLDVILSPGGSVRVEVPQGWSSFAYVYDGEPMLGGGGRDACAMLCGLWCCA